MRGLGEGHSPVGNSIIKLQKEDGRDVGYEGVRLERRGGKLRGTVMASAA